MGPCLVLCDSGCGAGTRAPARYNGGVGTPRPGITVIGELTGKWVGARGVWNQFNYRVTNVDDDLSIPTNEEPSWLAFNGYRAQELTTGCKFALPDLTASFLRITPSGPDRTLTVRVGNGGAAADAPRVRVTFYDGDPDLGGVPLGTVQTTSLLPPGQFEDVDLTLPAAVVTAQSIHVAADDDGNRKGGVSETSEENNVFDSGLALTASSGLPDLTVVLVTGASAVVDAQTLEVSGVAFADVRKQGDASSVGSVDVVFFEDTDLDGGYTVGADTLLGTTTSGAQSAGATERVSAALSGFLSFADAPVSAFVDSGDVVAESDETNNVGRSGTSCSFEPPPETWTPQLQWSWTSSVLQPGPNLVGSAPAVADLNQDSLPDVAFVSPSASNPKPRPPHGRQWQRRHDAVRDHQLGVRPRGQLQRGHRRHRRGRPARDRRLRPDQAGDRLRARRHAQVDERGADRPDGSGSVAAVHDFGERKRERQVRNRGFVRFCLWRWRFVLQRAGSQGGMMKSWLLCASPEAAEPLLRGAAERAAAIAAQHDDIPSLDDDQILAAKVHSSPPNRNLSARLIGSLSDGTR